VVVGAGVSVGVGVGYEGVETYTPPLPAQAASEANKEKVLPPFLNNWMAHCKLSATEQGATPLELGKREKIACNYAIGREKKKKTTSKLRGEEITRSSREQS
jgi:hypothetical protein